MYFLKKKTVLNYLKQFDVQTDECNVKRLKTDCSKKFCNRADKNYLFSKNIKHKTTLHQKKMDLLSDRTEQLNQ